MNPHSDAPTQGQNQQNSSPSPSNQKDSATTAATTTTTSAAPSTHPAKDSSPNTNPSPNSLFQQQMQQHHPFLFPSDAESPYQNFSMNKSSGGGQQQYGGMRQELFSSMASGGQQQQGFSGAQSWAQQLQQGARGGSSSNSSHSSGSSGIPAQAPTSNIMHHHHLLSATTAASTKAKKTVTNPKKRKRFTGDEDSMILEAVQKRKHPKTNHIDWDRVAEDCETLSRTKEQIRSRYSRIKKKEGLNIHTSSRSSTKSSVHQSSPATILQQPFQNPNQDDPSPQAKKKNSSATESVGSTSISNTSAGDFVSFFNAAGIPPSGEHSAGSYSNFSADGTTNNQNTSKSNTSTSSRRSKSRNTTRRKHSFAQTDSAHDYISQMHQELEETKKLLRDTIQANKEHQRRYESQTTQLQELQSLFLSQRDRYPKALLDVLKKSAQNERRMDAKKLRDECDRLGSITPRINGINVQEQWTPGDAFIETQQQQKDLEDQKVLIEKKRRVIQKLKSTLKKEMGSSDVDEDHIFELNEQETVYKLRLNDIKKEEQQLAQKLKQLEIEKRAHIREIKRQRDEERSRFNHFPTIGPDDRYFLIKLIGRGGFSEVYKAYDLKDLRVVACKIHQLNSSWKDTRKENYIKHVLRECQIHKKISHPRVVQMFDTFIYDENTYVTVLEYCSGYDLDMYLKKHTMNEKKAHNIISQVFSGLKYLAEPPRKIIHFDLKPANILYCNGEIKITDFGLSKMMDLDEDAIELTSQGAGTYWYLPPECFEVQNTPKISSKVDVWSAGVIFYQMLYGKKPFGNDMSQREVLHQRVITNAKVVTFPAKPAVSQEAKDFIRLCLSYDQSERPDMLQIYNHKYLRTPPKRGGSS